MVNYLVLRALESAGHWKVSETRMVVVGARNDVDTVLLHSCLRNTIHALYLALHPDNLNTRHPRTRLYNNHGNLTFAGN